MLYANMAVEDKSMAPEQPASNDKLPGVNDCVRSDDRAYKLESVLGDGGYGTVFQCNESDRKLAVKTEKYSKSMLHIEVTVLRAANAAKAKHFCELVDYGSVKPEYVFVVMTLLGKDVHRLRSEQEGRKFTLATAVRIGIQTAQAIEELHKIGYISRDVKPGNFAVGMKCHKQNKTIFLIDFGLARKYIDRNNNVIPSRKDVGWRGTTRYGSLHAHQRQDLSRRDDMESWFYMLVEITRGALPWRLVTDRAAVFTAKQGARGAGRAGMLEGCPKQYDPLLTMIDALQFEQTPDYALCIKSLDEVREEKGIKMDRHWDWEDETVETTISNSSLSDREQKAKNADSKE